MSLNFTPTRLARALLLGPLSTLVTASALAQAPGDRSVAREVAALLDIAQGEYELARAGGGVIDSLEYEEARVLLGQARELAAPLLIGDARGRALWLALDSAEARLERFAAVSLLGEAVEQARRALFQGWGVTPFPPPEIPPSAARGEGLYGAYCAVCHGLEGKGGGQAAPTNPPPTDFTDAGKALEVSAARLYQVTTYGIPGTGMPAWRDRLGEQERWDLVAYLLRLGHSDGQRKQGEELYATYCAGCHGVASGPGLDLADPENVAGLSGLEFLEVVRAGKSGAMPGFAGTLTDSQQVALLAHMRGVFGSGNAPDPGTRMAEVRGVIGRVQRGLERAIELHAAGDYPAARRTVLQAYMSFERLEDDLRLRAPEITRRLEGEFMDFREAAGSPDADPRALYARMQGDLQAAIGQLGRRSTIWRDLLQSLVIIVREGVEATLIITALLAFLIRSGNARHRRSMYWGAALAVGASVVTAFAVELIFRVAPAGREVLEGATMLIAVIVLFMVSYWLVSKVEQRRWERYIREKMNLALSSRSRFALASVAFLAVYREGFETVLFYKALMGGASSGSMVLVGFLLGVVVLAVLCVAIYRVGVRVPLRPFFALTSAVLYYMAFVFAGGGIKELQEAGAVRATVIAGVPRIDLLGVYPTVESLTAQAVLLSALLFALSWSFVVVPARARVQESALSRFDSGNPV
jgi:high-affinity iron transporter